MFNVIAVDDEANALNRFSRMVSQDDRLTLIGSFNNPLEALEFASSNTPDIAFLDIEMPQMTGLELAERLMDINPYIEVVFVTAYNQYALEAFQAHATGYLLKPLSRDDFSRQIDIMEKKLKKERPKGANKLIVNCLGSFSIRKPDNDETIKFRTSKAEELLAYLVHSEGRARSKDMILDTLWPDVDIDRAANNFRVTCTYIRSTLADIGYTDVLLRDHDDYSVNISRIQCDYIDFKKGIGNIQTLTLSDCETLLRLYSGPFLENRFYNWADESKGWLENRYMQLLYHAAKLYDEASSIDNSIECYERVLRLDLYEENAIKEVLRLKASKLPTQAVLDYFDKYCSMLYEEYGSEPSRELKAFVKTL